MITILLGYKGVIAFRQYITSILLNWSVLGTHVQLNHKKKQMIKFQVILRTLLLVISMSTYTLIKGF